MTSTRFLATGHGKPICELDGKEYPEDQLTVFLDHSICKTHEARTRKLLQQMQNEGENTREAFEERFKVLQQIIAKEAASESKPTSVDQDVRPDAVVTERPPERLEPATPSEPITPDLPVSDPVVARDVVDPDAGESGPAGSDPEPAG